MRKTLSKSEIKELNEELRNRFGLDLLDKKDAVVNSDDKLLLVNDEPLFFMHEGKWIPTLKLMLKNAFLKQIVVDMGAVKFVVSGADIMRPGIVEMQDDIKKDEYVVVVDVTNRKPLAIGQSMFDTETMKSMEKGKVIRTIHWVGDETWKAG